MPGATVPLDSYRFTLQAGAIPCFICEAGNTCDVEFCHHCGAPMALAHQANSQKICPRMLAVVGASGAGKTVYSGNAHGHALAGVRTATSSTPGERSRLPSSRSPRPPWPGASSLRKLPTSRTDGIGSIARSADRRTEEPLELIVPDMAGEVIFEELDHPQSSPVVRAYLSRCTGIMLLIDAIKLKEGCQEQDYMAMKVISHLAELDRDRKGGCRRPVAIVFSKADQCELACTDPEKFAATHAVGMWRQCQDRLQLYKFFAVGIAGACAWRDRALRHGARCRCASSRTG